MNEGVVKYKSGNVEASSEIVENARNYIALLSEHIRKEDYILYPMADLRLSPEKQEELLERFEKVELERIGKGKHEEFHQLLKELKGIYLK